MKTENLNYYRIKTECTVEAPDGTLQKKRIEELVLATCYTEVEKLALSLISIWQRDKFGSATYEILKTKISDVLYNKILAQEEGSEFGFCCNFFEEDATTGVGLYTVKVVFLTADEKTGKDKQVTEVFYVPAESNADAIVRINCHLKTEKSDYVIRDTKFDKAEAIYWPFDVQKEKKQRMESN